VRRCAVVPGALRVVVVVVVGVAAGRAEAFVRSMTDTGNPFYWKETCVPITIYLNGFGTRTGDLDADQSIKSITAAAHTWSTDAVSCTSAGVTTSPYLEIVPTVAPASATPPPAAWDAKNSIVFRTDMWSKSGSSDPTAAFAFEALAVTTVTARGDGHIVDVDMEINAVNKTWMNLDPGVGIPFDHGEVQEVFDLQNALTHEFGHFIGLAHTCFTPSLSNPDVDDTGHIRPKDDAGHDIPDCDDAPGVVENTVMFNTAPPGQTSKRTLAPDDIRGVCASYPASQATMACALDDPSPSCAVAPSRPAHRSGLPRGLGLTGLGLVVAVVARARGRR
jgi:hypothetical protein